jgi:phosphoadenosine phosphosulfate reductase
MKPDFDHINQTLGSDPAALIEWALKQETQALCTTNFGPFSPVLLHMVTRVRPDLPILWVDHGYATPANYQFADEVTKLLKLNLKIYHPLRSRAHREAVEGSVVPGLDHPELHATFTQEVKLEPFARATRELAPKLWLTAVRADQTAERAAMKPVSLDSKGIIKVAPLLQWSSKDMHEYLKKHGLPNNFDYFDPTKVEENRECGLHTIA